MMGTWTELRRTARARTAMLAMLLVSLAAGMLVPVYTDEVVWRFQLSRFLLDGGVDRANGETCGANTIAVPPLFMWPVRAFSSGVTMLTTGPFGVRLAGVVFAVVAVFLLRALIARLEADRTRRAHMELLAWSLLGFGVLPWLLVWSRPEQPLWLALLVVMLLTFTPARADGASRVGARLAGITAATLVALCYHPKTILYLPVFAAAAVIAGWGRRRRWAVGAALAVMATAARTAFRYWSVRFACPGDPVLAAKLGEENASVLLMRGDWHARLALVPRLLRAALPIDYLGGSSPAWRYMSDWLPMPVDSPLLRGWAAAYHVTWLLVLMLCLVSLVAAARDPARSWPKLAFAAVITGCAVVWAALQLNKNAYEAALYLPAALAAVLLAWSASARNHRWWRLVTGPVAALSLTSQLLLLTGYAPRLWAAGRGGGYVEGQRFSVSAFNYPRSRIVAAGARCGLAPRSGLRRVLVDDLTYFAYARTAMPLHRLGVLEAWNGSITDPGAWLHAHGSPGAVLACAYLPAAMRARAIATGAFCCVNTG